MHRLKVRRWHFRAHRREALSPFKLRSSFTLKIARERTCEEEEERARERQSRSWKIISRKAQTPKALSFRGRWNKTRGEKKNRRKRQNSSISLFSSAHPKPGVSYCPSLGQITARCVRARKHIGALARLCGRRRYAKQISSSYKFGGRELNGRWPLRR